MKKIFSVSPYLLIFLFGLLFSIPSQPVQAQESSIDLLPYFLGSNNPGDAVFTNDGQVKYEYQMPVNGNPNGFYIIKSRNQAVYEEFTYDNNFIYHLKDTSWADGSGDIFCTNGNPAGFTMSDGTSSASDIGTAKEGIKWAPRYMDVGETFNSDTTIIAFDKSNCVPCEARYTGNTGRVFRLEAVYTTSSPFTLPSGLKISDGIKLTIDSGPGAGESYWYDKNHGWVAFGRGGNPDSYAVDFGPAPTVQLKADPTNGGNFACQPFDGFYGGSGPGNLLANFGAQQCTQGELVQYTSRPSECGSCLDYVPEPVRSCASNFTYTKELKYTSFNTSDCNLNQCSLDLTDCSIDFGGEDVANLTETPQLIVGPIPWQGRFTLNASTVKQPYVGNDTEESREKYIADYVDGTTYYKTTIDPGSDTPEESLDPTGLFDPAASSYYQIPPRDPRFISYAGIVPKLASQEHLDLLKHQILDRVSSTIMSDIMPINDYTIGYQWGDKLQAKLSEFTSDKRRPLRSKFSTHTTYLQDLQRWQTLDNGKWFRLWSYVPLASRQDTPGRFHPIAQSPAAIVPVTTGAGGTIGNPPPLPGDIPPLLPPPPPAGNVPTPPAITAPPPGQNIWVYNTENQNNTFSGTISTSTENIPLLFQTISYRNRSNTDTTIVRFASRVTTNLSITLPSNNPVDFAYLLTPTSETPLVTNGQTISFTLPAGPGNYIIKTNSNDNPIQTLSIFVDDYNQTPQDPLPVSIALTPQDAPSLQSQINNASSGTIFYFGPGNYGLGNLNILNKQNLSFVLHPETIINQSSPTGEIFRIENSSNITFSGPGKIITPPYNQDTAFYVFKSRSVSLNDFLLYKTRTNDGWTLHVYRSSDIAVNKVRIFSGNDGTDPDSSSNVIYDQVYIESQDDAVAIKTRAPEQSTNIQFKNSFAKSAASGLKVGQNSVNSNIDQILFTNSTVYDTDRQLVVWPGTGDGKVGSVKYQNIRTRWIREDKGGYTIQVKEDGNSFLNNSLIEFNNLNADVLSGAQIDISRVVVTNSQFNFYSDDNSLFTNDQCFRVYQSNNTPSDRIGCPARTLSSNPLYYSKSKTNTFQNQFASSVPFSPFNSRVLAQALQDGAQGDNVYQPYPPQPNNLVQPAPNPVQLQLPHIARLYESATQLYDILAPWQRERPIITPTPIPSGTPTPTIPIDPNQQLKIMTFNIKGCDMTSDGDMRSMARKVIRDLLLGGGSSGPLVIDLAAFQETTIESDDTCGSRVNTSEYDIYRSVMTSEFNLLEGVDFHISAREGTSRAHMIISKHPIIRKMESLSPQGIIVEIPNYGQLPFFNMHPGNNCDTNNNWIDEALSLVPSGTDSYVLAGDFNINYLNKECTPGNTCNNDSYRPCYDRIDNNFYYSIPPNPERYQIDYIMAPKSGDWIITSTQQIDRTWEDEDLRFGETDHSPVISTLSRKLISSKNNNKQNIFSSQNKTYPLSTILASSQILSPPSNLQTSNSRLLAQGETAPQCLPQNTGLPAGCYPDGGCFTASATINPTAQNGIVHYCVTVQQTCLNISGAIGDVYWQINGGTLVKNIPAYGDNTTICSYYNVGTGGMPPLLGLPGSSGVLSGIIRANRDVSSSSCCNNPQTISCNYSVAPDGSVSSNCATGTPAPPAPPPAPICAPTVLGSVPNCSGTIRTGAGDFLCGIQTYDLIISQPDERFWNVNPYNSIAIDEDGNTTEGDGPNDFSSNSCGAAVSCDNCTCQSPNSVIGGSSGFRCYYDPGASISVSSCDNCPSSNPGPLVSCESEGDGSQRKCCGPGSTNSETDCRPLVGNPATPNICTDATAPQCVFDDGRSACVAKPFGSDSNIYGNQSLPDQELIYPASREIHIATELPYFSQIYKRLIGFPEGSTQFDPNNTPVYRMFTPFRGSTTAPDTVPWYNYHAGDASGWLSVSNKGEPNSTYLSNAKFSQSQDINQPFYFPYLGAIQDGTQFIRDCLTAGYPNGCTSQSIINFYEGKACSVDLSKISFYTNQVDQPLIEYLQAAKPPVIKVMGPALNQVDQIKSTSPSTLILGRNYSTKWESIPDQYNIEDLNSAITAAQDWLNDLNSINPSNQIDYWEGINEPVIGPANEETSQNRMAWLAKFEATRLRLLNSEGKKGCIGNFATGNPDNGTSDNYGVWPYFQEAFDAAVTYNGTICLHEYATATTTVDGFRMGRYVRMYDYLATTPNTQDDNLQTIISETGASATGSSDSGWRTIFNNDQERFLTAMREYNQAISSESRIIGATLFILNHPGWPFQKMEPEIISSLTAGATQGSDQLQCVTRNDQDWNINDPNVPNVSGGSCRTYYSSTTLSKFRDLGVNVKAGDRIATYSNTGYPICATGDHLHFVRSQSDGSILDPRTISSSTRPIKDPYITQNFGITSYSRTRYLDWCTVKEGNQTVGYHEGLDIVSTSGDTAVYAPKDGKLYAGSMSCGSSNILIVALDHNSELTWYFHIRYNYASSPANSLNIPELDKASLPPALVQYLCHDEHLHS